RREVAALEALAAEPRLGNWRSLLPQMLSEGEVSGRPYVVEGFVRGVEARRVIARSASRRKALAAAAATIGLLHRRTQSALAPIDGRLLARWVDEPASILSEAVASGGDDDWRGDAVQELGHALHEALAGRSVRCAWIHGDFVPGNIF